jgi:serine protease SohB
MRPGLRKWVFKDLFPERHVSLVRFQGQLTDSSESTRLNTLSFRRFENALHGAFMTNPKAVCLSINSPGGSPVQTSLLFRRIRALKKQYSDDYDRDIPVISAVQDTALSGGYYLACAGDIIIADRSSIVGSIGVIYQSFGFHRLINDYGVERRVHTSGTCKSQLDPFEPEKEETAVKLKDMLSALHESFKDDVRLGRGDRLMVPDEELFNGDFWAAESACEKGLIDHVGDFYEYCEEHYPGPGGVPVFVEFRPTRAGFPFSL